ncbi:MAG: hypothetical protein ACYCV0_06325 [Desulfitobacteriaceae bacterium]
MKKKVRIFITWIVISLLIQFAIYSFLDSKIAKVLAPPSNAPITASLTAQIPGTGLENPQLSYDKKYLAYMENGIFKVFNLKNEKLVFSKAPAQGSTKDMGVISYKWLPDRNTLIYFSARKNTAPKPPTSQTNSVPSESTTPAINSTPATSSAIQPSSGTSNNSGTAKITTLPSDSIPNKTPVVNKEDPAESTVPTKPAQDPSKPSTSAPSQTQPTKPYNPQITELYTLEFLDEEGIQPEDRKNDVESLDSYFPSGGEILHMDFSTSTNLIYLTVKSGNSMKLLEIDVMKDGSNLTKAGETITNLAVSDQYGTLYIDSKQGTSKQVLAVKGWQRYALSKQDNQYLLGAGNGLVYLGEVKNNNLVKILTVKDSSDLKNISGSIEIYWEGSIPYKNSKTVIGANGQVIIYNQAQAYVVRDGKVKNLELAGEQGETTYITGDGAELFQLSPVENSTVVELKPLDQ